MMVGAQASGYHTRIYPVTARMGHTKKKRFNMFCLSGYRVCAEAYNEWVRFFFAFYACRKMCARKRTSRTACQSYVR